MNLHTYQSVILLHDKDAKEILDLLEADGEQAALDRLKSLHPPGEGTLVSTHGTPWGDKDAIFKHNEYVMYYNYKVPYVGLVCRLELPPTG